MEVHVVRSVSGHDATAVMGSRRPAQFVWVNLHQHVWTLQHFQYRRQCADAQLKSKNTHEQLSCLVCLSFKMIVPL